MNNKKIKLFFRVVLVLYMFFGIKTYVFAGFDEYSKVNSHCTESTLNKTCFVIPLANGGLSVDDSLQGDNWVVIANIWARFGGGISTTESVCSCVADPITLADGSSVDVCSSVSIQTFCNSVSSCQKDANCINSLGEAYDNKIEAYKDSVKENLISESNLDSEKVNNIVNTGSCDGDLSCISKLINALASDVDFNASSTSSSDAEAPDPNSPEIRAVKNKLQGPSVKVTIDTLNGIMDGAKMTATAVPGGFVNSSDPSNLYFTWYIKHNNKQAGLDCDVADSLNDDNRNCDLDNDGKVKENDWKIAAVKTNMRAGFDWATVDYSKTPSDYSQDAAGVEAAPSVSGSKGWKKTYDRDLENDKDAPDCYIQDSETGNFFELRETTPVFDSCPSGTRIAYIQDQTTSCSDSSTTPATNVSGLKYCQVGGEEPGWGRDDLKCSVEDLNKFETKVEAKNGSDDKDVICIADNDLGNALNNLNVSTLFGKTETSANICSKSLLKNSSSIYFGQTDLAKCDSFVSLLSTDKTPTCSFEKDNNFCKHLFPYFPKNEVYGVDGKKINVSDVKNGDGKFSFEEKIFWGANPNANATNGKNKDEAAVIGLATDQLTWNYQIGDEIGVAVEGQSMLPTNHADSSYRIMWAFSKWTCSKLEKIEDDSDDNEVGFYADGNGIKTLTANFDLDDCLEENLLDPVEYGDNKMDIKLVANLKDPINDESGKGDDVAITASVSNVSNYNDIYYEWFVEESRDGSMTPSDMTQWVEITEKMSNTYKSFPKGGNQGFGKNEFSFNLNLSNEFLLNNVLEIQKTNAQKYGTYYLKVKAKATANLSSGKSQVLLGNTIIKVKQQQNQILIYPVTADINGKFSLNEGSKEIPTELTSAECDQVACYVTKNEVVGVKVSDENGSRLTNFSWKVNGIDFVCNEAISPNCQKPGSNVLFFPVLGNISEAVNVSATAMNETTGSKVDVSKHFVIVAPKVEIYSPDWSLVRPKKLGDYISLDGDRTPDYSTQVMEARAGSSMRLAANFYPISKAGQMGFDWIIDGQVQEEFHNKTEITIPVDKFAGDTYSVGLVAKYSPGADKQAIYTRKALFNNWHVILDDTSNINDNANIQINVMDNLTVAAGPQKSFAASLITHVSQQFMFLIKIVLTSFALLLTMGILFVFIPQTPQEGQ